MSDRERVVRKNVFESLFTITYKTENRLELVGTSKSEGHRVITNS